MKNFKVNNILKLVAEGKTELLVYQDLAPGISNLMA